MKLSYSFSLLCAFLLCAVQLNGQAVNRSDGNQDLDRAYQQAVSSYESGHYSDAASQLEKLLPYAPKSPEIHELLGLSYASESEPQKALEHLKLAVQFNPNSAANRTNLAAALSQAGKTNLAIEQLLRAVELEPADYTANHNLGELYVQSGKLNEAIPLLEAAAKAQPDSYDNSYDLAMACFLNGKLARARDIAQALSQQKNSAELHNLLGQIDEKDGKYVDSVNEFQTSAHMEPSEENLFAWGSELLLHRTYDPATEVFQQGTERYPKSPRLRIGLGMALYSRGKYDDAIKALLAAADLDPTDPRCYLFLSKAYDSSPSEADEVIQRFHRYAELEPNNAQAIYYYAMSRWKGRRAEDPELDLHAIELLLQKAVNLNPKFAEAHLQLGNLYADQHRYAKSLPEHQRAVALNDDLADAHYRLGQDYVHTAQKPQAEAEFATYQRLRSKQLADLDKERAEVQQFVLNSKPVASSKP